jgi:class 3 adenylate cyclase/predicted ATPase
LPDAERRQLTVMFCDVVGSTALSARLDPEDLRELLRAYHTSCAEVIRRFDGQIAQYLGDGILVYFGYPRAHEDDAERAIRAGLGIIDAMGRMNAQKSGPHEICLAVRIGIHTGLVVVGEVGGEGKHEQLAIGDTPNLAARLQSLAEPDSVIISGDTLRLVPGLFVVRSSGNQLLKGAPGPVQVFNVVGESGTLSRLDVAGTAGLTQLVGREQEVGLLLDRWERVIEGHGQVVLLSGEAGIGKSRLLQVIKERVTTSPRTRLECRCSPYYEHTPLYPVIDLLPRVFEWSRDDGPAAKLDKLRKQLIAYGVPLFEALPLLAFLLSLPAPEDYPLPPMSSERHKRKTLEVLLALLLAIAYDKPVLLTVEDLHWIDSSTLEFLTLLLDHVPTARILMLLAARPSFVPPWTPRAHLTFLTLTRFTHKQTELMVSRVSGGKALPAEIMEQIVAKTDGVPLFVEELTKMVLESGLVSPKDGEYVLTGPLPPLAIPTTLQDSLMARLDRLVRVKEVAQIGATLGRAFPYALIQAVHGLDEATLQRELGRLVEAELLYQRGVPPNATYIFKHALIQEAAYQALLKSTRQRYHQRVAQTMVERFPMETEARPEFVAHHFTEAGLAKEAIEYWLRAGQHAVLRSAHAEAVSHFSKALELINTVPETPDRIQTELALHVALGPALMATKGFAALEVEQAYQRALALCRQEKETPRLFPVLRGLWEFYELRGQLRTARELAEQLLSVAETAQDQALLLIANDAVGDTSLWLGEFDSGKRYAERGIALYQRTQHHSLAPLYGGYDAGVACCYFAAHSLWYLGYSDQALKRIHEALSLGRELSHPFSLAHALTFAAWLHQYRREPHLVRELSEEALRLASEQGIAFLIPHGTILRGWALAHDGTSEDCIVQIHKGLADYQAIGAELERPHWLALLADTLRKAGRATEGLRAIEEALAVVDSCSIRFCEAELYRLQGELLLTANASADEEAEACFHRALQIASRQDAKAIELRAAMSLARLWHERTRVQAAQHTLVATYGWFTEGFDTADLREAKTLIDELTGGQPSSAGTTTIL